MNYVEHKAEDFETAFTTFGSFFFFEQFNFVEKGDSERKLLFTRSYYYVAWSYTCS